MARERRSSQGPSTLGVLLTQCLLDRGVSLTLQRGADPPRGRVFFPACCGHTMSEDPTPQIPDDLHPYLDTIADRLLSGHAAVMVGAGFSRNAAPPGSDTAFPGRLEGRVGETLRGEPPDDPRMGRDGSVGPGPVVRGCALRATSSRAPQAGSLHRDHRGTSRGVPRSVGDASVRRGPRGGLPRWLQPCAGLRPRGTPARAGRGGGAVRDAGRGVRARWTSRRSRCPGAAGTPWWWC